MVISFKKERPAASGRNAGRSDAGKEVVDLRLGAAKEERTNLENHSSFSEAITVGGGLRSEICTSLITYSLLPLHSKI